MLKSRTWEEGGEYAAYHCQMRSLRLRPWQCPPCDANGEVDPAEGDGYGNRPDEGGLRQRLTRAGLSVFEPDPMAAISAKSRDHQRWLKPSKRSKLTRSLTGSPHGDGVHAIIIR